MRTVVTKTKNEVFFQTFRVNAYLFLWNRLSNLFIILFFNSNENLICSSAKKKLVLLDLVISGVDLVISGVDLVISGVDLVRCRQNKDLGRSGNLI